MTEQPYDAYRAHEVIDTRWEDEDVYGHVNNVKYYSYFDTAVNRFLIRASGTHVRHLDAYGVVAETGCRFMRELTFPEPVTAGLAVTKLGNSSVVYQIGLFSGSDPSPAAVGRFVHVYVESDTRKVTTIPTVLRDALEPLVVNW